MTLELARQLHALHAQPAPLLIYNAWDAGSAGAIRGFSVAQPMT